MTDVLQAITAGKRVRTETTIASGAVSVSSAAAELAQLKLPSHKLADARVSSVIAEQIVNRQCTRCCVKPHIHWPAVCKQVEALSPHHQQSTLTHAKRSQLQGVAIGKMALLSHSLDSMLVRHPGECI